MEPLPALIFMQTDFFLFVLTLMHQTADISLTYQQHQKLCFKI